MKHTHHSVTMGAQPASSPRPWCTLLLCLLPRVGPQDRTYQKLGINEVRAVILCETNYGVTRIVVAHYVLEAWGDAIALRMRRDWRRSLAPTQRVLLAQKQTSE